MTLFQLSLYRVVSFKKQTTSSKITRNFYSKAGKRLGGGVYRFLFTVPHSPKPTMSEGRSSTNGYYMRRDQFLLGIIGMQMVLRSSLFRDLLWLFLLAAFLLCLACLFFFLVDFFFILILETFSLSSYRELYKPDFLIRNLLPLFYSLSPSP